jgi:hypothetical protein
MQSMHSNENKNRIRSTAKKQSGQSPLTIGHLCSVHNVKVNKLPGRNILKRFKILPIIF